MGTQKNSSFEHPKHMFELSDEKKNLVSVYMYLHVDHVDLINEPPHEISNNVVCATSKSSDQPAHTRRLIRAWLVA